MAMKQMTWKTKGMNRDLSVSAFNPEFSFENMNMRLSTNDGNTLLSWVNEKGTKEISYIDGLGFLTGTPVGTAVIGRHLILFTAGIGGNEDCIYKLWYEGEQMKGELLYRGKMNLNVEYPLETLVSYESETVQKVYWTDGWNQPRVMNIAGKYYNDIDGVRSYKPSFIFDFIPELQLRETVKVQKKLGANGMFSPGVIQYCFTYYNKYCQESNIFYTTPLYYISHRDSGASPEDTQVDNAFQITIKDVDTNFEYLRIYSIQRTSLNGTPIAKRVQDIEIKSLEEATASYLDTGTSGNTIDPMELLYKGGSAIRAYTLEQKDGTLFLGNIQNQVDRALDGAKNPDISVTSANGDEAYSRTFKPQEVYNSDYVYSNQLTSTSDDTTVPCAGFKHGDVYRCGVQFQHKTGKWSDPTYIGNIPVEGKPKFNPEDKTIEVPILKGTIPSDVSENLLGKGYVKARAVVVYPSPQDRLTICQGVVCPTLYTQNHRDTDKDLYAQSSWFFRPLSNQNSIENPGTVPPSKGTEREMYLEYTETSTFASRNSKAAATRAQDDPINDPNENTPTQDIGGGDDSGNTPSQGDDVINPGTGTGGSSTSNSNVYDPKTNIRQVEIQGAFDPKNRFKIDSDTVTFHSPDVEFDTQLAVTDYSSFRYKQVGNITFEKTFSDIDIQTETPTASDNGAGFTHKRFVDFGTLGIVSGLFYDDYVVNDTNGDDPTYMGAYEEEACSCKWMVYLWNKTGSLNNDINRPTDQGVASAVLRKKVISNLRYAKTTYPASGYGGPFSFTVTPQLFNSEEPTIAKLGSNIYMGNIDAVLNPDDSEGMYFVFNNTSLKARNVKNEFFDSNEQWWKTYYDEINTDIKSVTGTVYYLERGGGSIAWKKGDNDFFDKYGACAFKKDFVRMKYKSTPHLVFTATEGINWGNRSMNYMPIVEINRVVDDIKSLFGGETMDALKENVWVPCGEPVALNASEDVTFEYSYGDTYYQRYDCLKTYPYTNEDENQLVEIGSFMLETRMNIDGRYDKNRGQLSNLNMRPTNFNLINPVYSQLNNFFTYRILDDDFYVNTVYPNQVTWSKTKQEEADVDLWTNVTLASTLDLDGDKGKLNKLVRLNNQLFAFQDTGISQILYNENTQIATTEGVPIEIANSGKVQGKRYLSNTVGCSNKWSITTTPNGIYFMDSNDKSIYQFNGQLGNLSSSLGFNSWCKQNIPSAEVQWNPKDFGNFRAFYDKLNQDVLFVSKNIALAYSEKLGAFTSFYDYGDSPYFVSLYDKELWVRNSPIGCTLHEHQAGEYCRFFKVNKPCWMTLVGNPEPQVDKTFTNIEFRASVEGDGELNRDTGKFTPTLPFDSLETWDEYQHGIAYLKNMDGHRAMVHHMTEGINSLKRKFRIWRCDIPRDNVPVPNVSGDGYESDEKLGVSRFRSKPLDRMRNPWLYVKMMKNAISQESAMHKIEVHDLMMTYYR